MTAAARLSVSLALSGLALAGSAPGSSWLQPPSGRWALSRSRAAAAITWGEAPACFKLQRPNARSSVSFGLDCSSHLRARSRHGAVLFAGGANASSPRIASDVAVKSLDSDGGRSE